MLCRRERIESLSSDKQWKATVVMPSVIDELTAGKDLSVKVIIVKTETGQQYMNDRLSTGAFLGDSIELVQVIWSPDSKNLYLAYTN
jgi:hypothetical protein